MSLASKLAAIEQPLTQKSRKGPLGVCHIYGPGTLEDWQTVEDLRTPPEGSWAHAQACVDLALGITHKIPLDNFRYHWRRRCSCWSEDLRR